MQYYISDYKLHACNLVYVHTFTCLPSFTRLFFVITQWLHENSIYIKHDLVYNDKWFINIWAATPKIPSRQNMSMDKDTAGFSYSDRECTLCKRWQVSALEGRHGCRAILEHWLADLWRFPGVSLRAGCAALFLGGSQVQRKEQVRGSPPLSDPPTPSTSGRISGEAPASAPLLLWGPCLLPLWSLTFWNTVHSWTTFLEWPLSLK